MIKWYVASGYEVWTVDMPVSGLNAGTVTVADPLLGNITVYNHDHMQALETPTFNPLRIFMEPFAAIVDNLQSRGITNVGMAGLSGGGWSTVLYSALDTRIKSSYSVAGSMPMYARSWAVPNDSKGDWEQIALPSYGFDYLDLYVLAAVPNRAHFAIHNVTEDCCFGGYHAMHYEQATKNVAASIGGLFDVVFDTTATNHTITPWAANSIQLDTASRY
jgi:hypothetical protein